MKLYTLSRKFLREAEIEKFNSAIWTERYYGDSEVELIVPMTQDMVQKLPVGVFLVMEGSKEVMIIETVDIDNGIMKLSGISLMKWMNNRFIRTSSNPADRYWAPSPSPPGWLMWAILYYWCINGSQFLDSVWPMGVPNPERLKIMNLGLKGYDQTEPVANFAIPFGPVYDAMREIGVAYQIGMTITLEWANESASSLQYLNYKGGDRTSRQTINSPVRFSPEMDNLINVKELRSIQNFKNSAYSFCPSNPGGLAYNPGVSISDNTASGFDLRAVMTFEEDISTDPDGLPTDSATFQDILNARARKALDENRMVKAIDGEIVPSFQYQYGRDYYLGDLIEVQGNSGIVQISRVTEYIRAQDAAGERAYPTVAMLE